LDYETMTWYSIFDPELAKWIALGVFVVAYAIILWRKFNIAYVSLIAAAVLILLGITNPAQAFLRDVNWDVLLMYWGYSMLSFDFLESKVPTLIVNQALSRIKSEKYAILFLCVLAMVLSSVLPNPVVVIMLAPIAIEMSDKLKGSLFKYMIALAISANVVTTVSMIADPPALILALETGMQFLDFYWFQDKLGIGTISVMGIAVALFTLVFQFRKLNNKVSIPKERISIRWTPSVLFLVSVIILAVVPWNSLGNWNHPGLVGLALALICLPMGASRHSFKRMIKESDATTLAFLVGIFVAVATIQNVGLLNDFSTWLGGIGLKSSFVYLTIFTWLSVILSAFIDNVPYTVLMIPVCTGVANALGVNPFPFYFGMLIGTGIGGNLTPVGATANVLACGMLEKRGIKIELSKYIAIAWPFTFAAVMAAYLLTALFWL
jgi:Na+/H+ antiporter NhaD/arsenite permease-like protein